MFEANLLEAGILKKILEAIKELLNEATFDCSEAGINLHSMDASHVALVNLNLKAEGFEKYKCDRNMSMGITMASLGKILKCANNDDVVKMKAADDGNTVTFTFESKKEGCTSDYEMKLVNLDQERLGVPETEYACTVKMSSEKWAKYVRNLSQFGESIAINCVKEGIQMSAKGDIGSANVKLAQNPGVNDNDSVDIQLTQPVNLTFASRYLQNFTKAAALSDRVSLSMSPEAPLRVEFEIKNFLNMRFYLAPKIEDDD